MNDVCVDFYLTRVFSHLLLKVYICSMIIRSLKKGRLINMICEITNSLGTNPGHITLLLVYKCTLSSYSFMWSFCISSIKTLAFF